MILTNAHALALLGSSKQVKGSTQKITLSKNMKIRTDPISADPILPLSELPHHDPDVLGRLLPRAGRWHEDLEVNVL